MKRLIMILFVFFCLSALPVHAAQEVSMDEWNREGKEKFGIHFSIGTMLKELQEGRVLSVVKDAVQMTVKDAMDLQNLKEVFVQILMVGFLLAVFSNFTEAFSNQSLGTTGFYIVAMILSGLLVQQFLYLYGVAQSGMEDVVNFMKLLIPTYSMVLMGVSGLTTSLASYELLFGLITLVQWGILNIVLPMIKFSFVLRLLNFLSGEDLFSGMIKLLERMVGWMLKGAIMVVLLFNIFQSMLLPAIDSVKSNVIQKGLGFLPGLGQVFGMVANTAIGSGIILKNAIGVAGMIIICMLLLVPAVKMLLLVGSFWVAGAILQPITNKKVYEIIQGAAESGKWLLQAMATAAALFLLTLAIVSVSTNLNYYVG